MDHLLHFNSNFEIPVPLYCDFNDLCAAQREDESWDTLRLRIDSDLQGHNDVEINAFFQSKLYFCFLAEFFEGLPDFDPRDFVKTSEANLHVVTTFKLQYWLTQWYNHHSAQFETGHTKSAYCDKVESLLRDIFELMTNFCSQGPGYPYLGPVHGALPHPLRLSILLLFSALEKATTQLLQRQSHFYAGSSTMLISILKSDGWCPSVIEWLANRSIDCLYTACTMERPDSRVFHGARCSPHRCVAYNISDELQYKQTHISNCKGCRAVSIAPEKLVACITDGYIPTVAFSIEYDDLVVRNMRPGGVDGSESSYIAISHVWSDGLGNPFANTIPLCQAQSIQSKVDHLAHSTHGQSTQLNYWWLDTTRVPVRPLSMKARSQAIQNMKSIYEDAEAVLVLDRHLRSKTCHRNAIEVFFDIICSQWMRRLWTFQEGIVAARIFLQFKDGPAPLDALYRTMLTVKAPIMLYTWYEYDCIEMLQPFIKGPGTDQNHLVAVFRALTNRGTTRQSDETVYLSNTLGLDTAQILLVDEMDFDGRMIKFLHLLHRVPTLLLFQQPPQIQSPGYTWAPRSLLRCFRNSLTSFIYHGGDSYLTMLDSGQGVTANLPALLLTHPTLDRLVSGRHTGIEVHSNGRISNLAMFYFLAEASDEKTYDNLQKACKRPAIIFYFHPDAPTFDSFPRGILVERNVPEQCGPASVSYVALIGLGKVSESFFAAQKRQYPDFSVWQGQYADKSAEWRIQ